MNIQELTIDVKLRTVRGKKNKNLRKAKQVPAVVYGFQQKNLSLSLDMRQAEKYYKKAYENKIFTFKSDNKDLDGLKVIRKDVSIDKIKRTPIHIDFFTLDMKKVIRLNLEIEFKGIPKGVKEEGGVINIPLRTIEVECLPDKIPSSLVVDVSELGLNEAIHVSDLKISADLKLITKPERTLCTVVNTAEEEVKTDDGLTAATTADATTADATTADASAGATPAAEKKTAEKKTTENKKSENKKSSKDK